MILPDFGYYIWLLHFCLLVRIFLTDFDFYISGISSLFTWSGLNVDNEKKITVDYDNDDDGDGNDDNNDDTCEWRAW